jgi:hypothetical protein
MATTRGLVFFHAQLLLVAALAIGAPLLTSVRSFPATPAACVPFHYVYVPVLQTFLKIIIYLAELVGLVRQVLDCLYLGWDFSCEISSLKSVGIRIFVLKKI